MSSLVELVLRFLLGCLYFLMFCQSCCVSVLVGYIGPIFQEYQFIFQPIYFVISYIFQFTRNKITDATFLLSSFFIYFVRFFSALSNKFGIKAMASSSNPLSVAQPLIPTFKGESYEFWSIRMKTILKSQDLWDLNMNLQIPTKEIDCERTRKKMLRRWCLSNRPSMIESFQGSLQQLHQSKLCPFCKRSFKVIQKSWW